MPARGSAFALCAMADECSLTIESDLSVPPTRGRFYLRAKHYGATNWRTSEDDDENENDREGAGEDTRLSTRIWRLVTSVCKALQGYTSVYKAIGDFFIRSHLINTRSGVGKRKAGPKINEKT